MKEEKIRYLLKNYAKSSLSLEEKEELMFLLQSGVDDDVLGQDMQKIANELMEEDAIDEIPSQQLWTAIKEDPRLKGSANICQTKKRNTLAVYYAAAVAVCIVGLGLYFTLPRSYQEEVLKQTVASENQQLNAPINPGTQQATLTLPDGKVVALAEVMEGRWTEGDVYGLSVVDGALQYKGNEDDIVPLMATLATPRGGEYQLKLADGTRVWLNASSSIRYPINFTADRREVYVEGEVYFDVEKDINRPFIVHAEDTKITVLGTEFNVSAYPEESHVRTTLVEGRVEMKKGGVIRQLRPGQQARTMKGESEHIAIQSVDIEEMVAWKNGYFYFHNESIKSAMEKIARWYDVEVTCTGGMAQKGLDGTISRMENLDQLLQALELTGTAKFKREGRRIIVSE